MFLLPRIGTDDECVSFLGYGGGLTPQQGAVLFRSYRHSRFHVELFFYPEDHLQRHTQLGTFTVVF